MRFHWTEEGGGLVKEKKIVQNLKIILKTHRGYYKTSVCI